MFLITPPGAFDPTKKWQEYLDRLKTQLPQNDPSVRAAIRHAEEELSGRRKSYRPPP
jgi:hypothetical protein